MDITPNTSSNPNPQPQSFGPPAPQQAPDAPLPPPPAITFVPSSPPPADQQPTPVVSESPAAAPVGPSFPPNVVTEASAPQASPMAAATQETPQKTNGLTDLSALANQMAIPARPVVKKAGAPKATIIVAIVIAAVLATLAVMAFLKTNKSGTAINNKTAPITAKVTGSDVGQTTQQIDDSLKGIDDIKDFDDAALSDSSLGL